MIDNHDAARNLWIEDLEQSGFGMATIASGSMSPVLNVGDKVYVKFGDQSNYKTGEIVVFPVADSLMTHRIVGSLWTPRGKLFIHRGDNASAMAFGLVKQEQILGRPIIANNDSKVISVSSLPRPRTIKLLSPYYSLLALALLLRRMGGKVLRRLQLIS